MKLQIDTISKKILLLNKTVLESMQEKSSRTIIKNFTETGIKILGADFGWAWWKFKDEQEYKLAYKSPNTPYTPKLPREGAGNYTALITKKPVFKSDVKKESLPSNYPFINTKQYIKSYIIIPIYYGDNVYGSINICYKKRHDFTENELVMAQAIGNATAQAKTTKRLFESEKKARISSEKQEAHFRALVENSYEIIVHIDSKGKILYISPSIKKIIGLDYRKFVGKNLVDLSSSDNKRKTVTYLKEVLENPQKRHIEEFNFKTKDGSHMFFESTSAKMPDEESDGGIVINIRNITEHKKLEEAKKSERQLAEEKIKVDAIADATHELRTPLAIIKGNVDLAKQGKEKTLKSLNNIIHDIDDEVKHLSEIVSDLALITSKPKGSQSMVLTEKVNIGSLVMESIDRCRSLAYKKKISITAKNIKNVSILGNKNYLEKMLTNLIKNSINYGNEKGHTNITTAVSKGFVSIQVEDDGIGISEGDLPHVFERFYRGDKSHSSVQSEGTGLGLSIVKWIAEIHKGTASVKSAVNKGTTFTVKLPLKAI